MTEINKLRSENGGEIAAIILICRAFLGISSSEELKKFLATHKIDWPLFYKITRANNLRPVVYNVIAALGINEELTNKLREDCRKITVKNFEQYREIIRLNNLLKNAHIAALPYKGCLYGVQFYKDASLRESSDMDFLIGRADIDAVSKLMVDEHYATNLSIPLGFREYYYYHIREFKFFFFNNGKRLFLAEFHTLVNDPVFETQSPVPNSYLFDSPAELSLHGNTVSTLSPTKHFIAMVTHHGIAGQWSSLKNLVDVAAAIRNGTSINWEEVHACSDKYRFKKILSIGFLMTEELFGIRAPLPAQYSGDITPWMNRLLSNHLYDIDRTWRNNFVLKVRSRDNLADRADIIYRHLAHLSSPSLRDYNFVRLPPPLFFLYAFIRPVRMLVGAAHRQTTTTGIL